MVPSAIACLLPDEDLVRRCRGGEEEAFSQLYLRYRRPVLSTACRIIGNQDEAQDATQEIFLKVYRSLSEWDPCKSKLSTWLYRLAANHAIDCWRAQRRRLRSEIAAEPPDGKTYRCVVSDLRHTPQIALEGKETVLELYRCARRLPRLQKRFFFLRYFGGLRLEEIALYEGRSLGSVKGSLFRATRAVRRRLLRTRRISVQIR